MITGKIFKTTLVDKQLSVIKIDQFTHETKSGKHACVCMKESDTECVTIYKLNQTSSLCSIRAGSMHTLESLYHAENKFQKNMQDFQEILLETYWRR